ncbi:hypothetical protein GCM10023116_29580 [Kistimonas scapharcae]|uniref:Uncharacterized protein n=1 Tax=Kistimonas scapharcae TaxID=1036133 RepID=A0ABP8V6J1_9GAMM
MQEEQSSFDFAIADCGHKPKIPRPSTDIRKDSNRSDVFRFAMEKYNDAQKAESFVRGWFKRPNLK